MSQNTPARRSLSIRICTRLHVINNNQLAISILTHQLDGKNVIDSRIAIKVALFYNFDHALFVDASIFLVDSKKNFLMKIYFSEDDKL